MERDEDGISPAEAARERRRDRDAEAHARAGMRTGLAKQFKQVLDTQLRRAQDDGDREAEGSVRRQTGRDASSPTKRKPE